MKNLQYFTLAIGLCFASIACEKNELIEQNPQVAAVVAQDRAATTDNIDNRANYDNWLEEEYQEQTTQKSNSQYKEYPVNASCSSNNLMFAVKGAPAPAAVRLYNSASRQTTYYPMASSVRGRDLQEVTIQLPSSGNWTYEYVHAQDQASFPNSAVYPLRNTAVTISPDRISSLYWPFSDDRSSWVDQDRWEGLPTNDPHSREDNNAQEWNWGRGHEDLGKLINSPVDGRVIYAADLPIYGNVVDILHESNGRYFLFRVAHLEQLEVEKGDIVDNTTFLGSLGRTGSGVNAQFPNAYCVLYEVDQNNRILRSLDFKFDAVCQR